MMAEANLQTRLVDLAIGQVYGCKLGYIAKVGAFIMVLNHPPLTDTIDREINDWTQSYLAGSIDHLTLKEDRPLLRLVVAVDRVAKTVTRGLLFSFQKEKGQALVDLVDLGEMRVVPIANLFEATREVKETKWKTVPCLLDGTNIFMGTDYLLQAFNTCGDLLNSSNLQMTIKGKCETHFIVQLNDLTQSNGNVNEKIFDHIDNACALRITENFIGTITHVEEDGQINIITPAGDTLQPLDIMDRFLRTYSVGDLQVFLPASTPENVDVGKVYVAKNSDDGEVYRARILALEPLTATIQYIDYGDPDKVKYSNLFLAQHYDQAVARLRALGMKAYLKWIREITDVEKAKDFLLSKDWKIKKRKEFRNYEPVVCVIDPENEVNANQTLVHEKMATQRHKPAQIL